MNLAMQKKNLLATRTLTLLIKVLMATWLLTLGVFVDTRSASVLSLPTSVEAITEGEILFKAYIGQSAVVSRGVPYLFQFTTDQAPFPLILVISVDDSTGITQLNLTGLYTEGNDESNRLGSSRVIRNGHRFKLTKDTEGSLYFSESIPAVISSDRATNVRLVGEAIRESGDKLPFDLTLNVPFEREQERYLGWMKLLYYDQF